MLGRCYPELFRPQCRAQTALTRLENVSSRVRLSESHNSSRDKRPHHSEVWPFLFESSIVANLFPIPSSVSVRRKYEAPRNRTSSSHRRINSTPQPVLTHRQLLPRT